MVWEFLKFKKNFKNCIFNNIKKNFEKWLGMGGEPMLECQTENFLNLLSGSVGNVRPKISDI